MKIKYLLIICTLLIASLLIAGCGNAQVAKDGDKVYVHYTGTLDDGSEFDTSRDGDPPLEFVIGAGGMIPGFENAVKGMEVGEIKTVTLSPEEAYGPHDEELIITVSREILAEGIEPQVGQQLVLTQAQGQEYIVTVTEITETDITIDGNHPLAGKELTFEVELMEIETPE